MSNGEHTSAARWLAGILIGFVLTSIGGLSGVQLVHERRISSIETRQEDAREQLGRIEHKLDVLLKWEKP